MLFEKAAVFAGSTPIPAKTESGRIHEPPRVRGSAHRLIVAVHTLADGHGTLLHHRQVPWASITFSGWRHTIALLFAGPAALAGGEKMIGDLADHEFILPGKVVADATVTEVIHTLQPEEKLQVTLDILVLDDA